MRALRRAFAVTAMTVGVTAMTATAALADDAPAEPETATPLEVRPSRPLETAAPESGGSVWTKVGLCGLIFAGAAAFYMKKRGPAASAAVPAIKVAARTSIGVRSEIILVDVDGHRLLLGVTPSSVRTLSVLPVEPTLASETAEEAAIGAARSSASPASASATLVSNGSLGSSFDRLLARAREEELEEPPPPPRATKPRRRPEPRVEERQEETDAYEGQVAVLRHLRPKR